MQNRDIWFRISSLYGSQTSTMVFPFKTAWLAPELLVFMCPRPHLSFCTSKKNVINIVITSLYGSQPSSVVFAGKTATFGSELKVSMGPRHHLGFFARKTTWIASELLFSMGPRPHLLFYHIPEYNTDFLATQLCTTRSGRLAPLEKQ